MQDLIVSPAGFGNKVVGRDSLGKRTADFRQRGFARGWDGGCRISSLQLLGHYWVQEMCQCCLDWIFFLVIVPWVKVKSLSNSYLILVWAVFGGRAQAIWYCAWSPNTLVRFSPSVGHNLLRYCAETGSKLLHSPVDEVLLGGLKEQAPHSYPCVAEFCYCLHKGAGDEVFLFPLQLVGFNLIKSYLTLA